MMRILVVGVGALGGYFGGRLKAAGRDVTFLVRPGRAAQLAKTGLAIRSALGDLNLPKPPIVTTGNLREPFDLVLLSCKAYDLESAMESFASAVGRTTAILPLLNGMIHVDLLGARFGAGAVLGGQCLISATLDSEGRILHLNDLHLLSFGEQNGSRSARTEAIAAALSGAGFDAHLSLTIMQEMWEKWAFIAAAAGIGCLMRGAFGDIVAAGASRFGTELFAECCAIAAANSFPPGNLAIDRSRAMITAPGSPVAPSMLRDIERGAPIEADHIVGDLLRRGGNAADRFPLLQIAFAHLKTYEARRLREKGASAAS
jgi:2-dehydropantoate 2-reductase